MDEDVLRVGEVAVPFSPLVVVDAILLLKHRDQNQHPKFGLRILEVLRVLAKVPHALIRPVAHSFRPFTNAGKAFADIQFFRTRQARRAKQVHIGNVDIGKFLSAYGQ